MLLLRSASSGGSRTSAENPHFADVVHPGARSRARKSPCSRRDRAKRVGHAHEQGTEISYLPAENGRSAFRQAISPQVLDEQRPRFENRLSGTRCLELGAIRSSCATRVMQPTGTLTDGVHRRVRTRIPHEQGASPPIRRRVHAGAPCTEHDYSETPSLTCRWAGAPASGRRPDDR